MPLLAYPVGGLEPKGLNFDSSLNLHPYFVYASSKGSEESAYLQNVPLRNVSSLKVKNHCHIIMPKQIM